MPNSPYASVALIAVLVLLMYFVILRPQKKRQQQQAKTLSAVEPGTRVMLTSGIFATVVAVGEKQMVVETSPGVQLTILKQAMSRAVPAGDEDEPSALDTSGATHPDSVDQDYADNGSYGSDSTQSDPVWPPSPPESFAPTADDSASGSGTSPFGQSSLSSSAFDRPDSSTEQSSQSNIQPNKE